MWRFKFDSKAKSLEHISQWKVLRANGRNQIFFLMKEKDYFYQPRTHVNFYQIGSKCIPMYVSNSILKYISLIFSNRLTRLPGLSICNGVGISNMPLNVGRIQKLFLTMIAWICRSESNFKKGWKELTISDETNVYHAIKGKDIDWISRGKTVSSG